jgi:hypothetical protein
MTPALDPWRNRSAPSVGCRRSHRRSGDTTLIMDLENPTTRARSASRHHAQTAAHLVRLANTSGRTRDRRTARGVGQTRFPGAFLSMGKPTRFANLDARSLIVRMFAAKEANSCRRSSAVEQRFCNALGGVPARPALFEYVGESGFAYRLPLGPVMACPKQFGSKLGSKKKAPPAGTSGASMSGVVGSAGGADALVELRGRAV